MDKLRMLVGELIDKCEELRGYVDTNVPVNAVMNVRIETATYEQVEDVRKACLAMKMVPGNRDYVLVRMAIKAALNGSTPEALIAAARRYMDGKPEFQYGIARFFGDGVYIGYLRDEVAKPEIVF